MGDEQVAISKASAGGHVQPASSGERQTRSGGTVGIYTDITGIKNSEQRRRKRELNAKSSQLRATLDNLVQGVSVFDHRHELAYWNRRFLELMSLPGNMVRTGLSFDAIVHCDSFRKAFPDAGLELDFVTWTRSSDRIRTFRAEYVRCDGLVVEVQRNVLPGGGFVSTYTDVTERRRAAEELEEIHRSLEKRVAERTVELTELNEQLRLAKAAADDANLSKTRFLAAASHDLLQPLNAARLFVCALLDSDVPAELRRLTRGADNALRSVDELLTTLLEISKLDAGVVKAERSDFPVGALLDAMAFEFAMVAQKKGIVLRVVPCKDQIHSDMLLLRRILQNFVSNAIRYTTRGKVLIGCRHRAGWLSIEVWDTGPGIPQEHQQAVFGEFQRFEPAGASRTTGVGLGLAIAQRSAKILEHPLHVRSEVGKGSVFAVHVPRGRQARPASVDPGPAVVPTYGMGEATIVFIENDENTLEGMTALLTRWSCQVLPAHTVDEAIKRISGDDIHPDLVIADYHLDGSRTGLDAIASVRRHCNLPIPGIIVTADHAEALQDLVHKAGYELLQKPIKPAGLRSLISHMLT